MQCHVYPLAAPPGAETAGPGRRVRGWAAGGLAGLCGQAAGLLLGPVFAAETHGYDTIDHFHIDPRSGDQQDFDHLVAKGRRGLRVALERNSAQPRGPVLPAFRAALAGGPGSAGRQVVPARPGQRRLRHVRGTSAAGCPGPRGDGVRRPGHDPLARPRRVRLAARRRLRRAAGFWPRYARCRKEQPGSWRDDPRRLRGLRQRPAWTRSPSTSCGRPCNNQGSSSSWPGRWRRSNELLGGLVPQTFLGNHDVTRLASPSLSPTAGTSAMRWRSCSPSAAYRACITATSRVCVHQGGQRRARPTRPTRPAPGWRRTGGPPTACTSA